MSKLTRGIGSVVMALFMYSVPVMLGYAFAVRCNGFFKTLFVACAIVQFICLTAVIYQEGER